jgi:hypothetical protein
MSSTMVNLAQGWGNAEATEIEGIVRVQRKGEQDAIGEPYETDKYAVHLEAVIEADSAEEAADRAMHLRDWFAGGPDRVRGPDFYWHLHGQHGC